MGYAKVCNQPEPSTTIHNHPQPPATIHNHPQPSATTRDHPQPPTTILNYPQLSTTTHNHPQLPTTIHNQPQPSTTTHNNPEPPKTIHNHPQPPTFIQNHKKENKKDKKRINFNFRSKGLFICSSEYGSHCLFLTANASEIICENIDDKPNVLYISNWTLLQYLKAILNSYWVGKLPNNDFLDHYSFQNKWLLQISMTALFSWFYIIAFVYLSLIIMLQSP